MTIQDKNKKRINVIFLPNGNTGVFENNEQVPELQKSWFIKFVEFLEKNDVDVMNSTYELPLLESQGVLRKAKLTKTEDGYDWSI